MAKTMFFFSSSLWTSIVLMFVSICQRQVHACETIHCTGRVLEKIQMNRVFEDSKHFVDMPSKYPPAQIEASFDQLPSDIDNVELKKWVEDNFFQPGFEVDEILPIDWKPDPKIVNLIDDERLSKLISAIHHRWRELVRIYNTSKMNPGSVSSHFPLSKPFVVPGGRFNEFYYWDSYWILQGLLISEMQNTARDLLTNLLETIRMIGFIPNGSRRYYDNRSQPPVLGNMMRLYEDRTGDQSFIRQHLRLLDVEYEFWMRERSVKLKLNSARLGLSNTMPSSYGNIHLLNLYRAHTERPRPESFYEDVEQTSNMTQQEKVQFYSNTASVAESGWDFSSRWMNFSAMMDTLNDPDFVGIKEHEQQNKLLQLLIITDLLPFDLNGILYQYERTLQMFYCRWRGERAEYKTKCKFYGQQARKRFWAMRAFMYDNETGLWSDYNLQQQKANSKNELPAKKCTNLDEPQIRLIHQTSIDATRYDPPSCSKSYESSERPLYVSDIGSIWYFDNFWRTDDVLDSLKKSAVHEEEEIEQELHRINLRIVRDLIKNVNDSTTSADPHLSPFQRMLLGSGGAAMSNVYSGQQWDQPNAWAPFQQYVITGLLDQAERLAKPSAVEKEPLGINSGNRRYLENVGLDTSEILSAQAMARKLSRNWLRSNYCGWFVKTSLYEKYDVRRPGQAGAGGEYAVQEGFGWTNGVAMRLAELYGAHRMIFGDCPNLP